MTHVRIFKLHAAAENGDRALWQDLNVHDLGASEDELPSVDDVGQALGPGEFLVLPSYTVITYTPNGDEPSHA